MKEAKTHYATVDRANESDNQDYWSNTLCGLEYTESPLSDRIESITCKTCLKRHERHRTESKRIYQKPTELL